LYRKAEEKDEAADNQQKSNHTEEN
jgi:hypothetical protein